MTYPQPAVQEEREEGTDALTADIQNESVLLQTSQEQISGEE